MSLGQRAALLAAVAGVVLWQSPDARAGAAELLGQLGDHGPATSTAAPVRAGAAVAPVAGGCESSGYGRRWGTFHYGLDVAAPLGTPIRSVLAGEVTYSGPAQGYGQMMRVQSAGGPVLEYGHMRTRLAGVGAKVRAGQVIARVGEEGEATGPHLHLRVYPGGSIDHHGVDPVPWLKARGVRVATC